MVWSGSGLDTVQSSTSMSVHSSSVLYTYTITLAQQGDKLVAQLLRTEVPENAENTSGERSLTNVHLLATLKEIASDNAAVADKIGQWIMRIPILGLETSVNVMV